MGYYSDMELTATAEDVADGFRFVSFPAKPAPAPTTPDTLDLDDLIPATIDAYTLVTPHTVREMPPGVGRDAAEAWLEAVELDDAELLTEALLDLIGAGVIPNPRPGVCQGCLHDCPSGATYCAECAAYHGLAIDPGADL